jgi:hypothetical protein
MTMNDPTGPAEAAPEPAPKPPALPSLEHLGPYVLVLAALTAAVWLQDKALIEKYLDLIVGAGLLAINPKGRSQ